MEAARRNHTASQIELATMYLKGQGGEVNRDIGLQILAIAAKGGSNKAAILLQQYSSQTAAKNSSPSTSSYYPLPPD